MEKKVTVIPGIIGVLIQILLLSFSVYHGYTNWYRANDVEVWILPLISFIIVMILFNGYLVIEPNMAVIISFMGKYKGTIRANGFFLKNPFYSSNHWSLRVCNYAMEPLKVNEKSGIPIEIAATIVWQVGDTYKAQYEVADLNEYIDNQFEVSLRKLAKEHTYNELASEDKDFINDLTEKVSKAGVKILDAKITHLNYVPEIAAVMLQKQQANALGEAREIIVDNAVNIAKKASSELGEIGKEQKVKFISDLVVVLCSEKAVSPVISV